MIKIDRGYLQELTGVRKILELDAFGGFFKLASGSSKLKGLKKITEKLAEIHDASHDRNMQVMVCEENFFKTLIEIKANRFISDFYSKLFFTCSVLDLYCLIDETDFITNKKILILSMSEYLFSGDREQLTRLLNDSYHAVIDMYLEALKMLELP